MNSKKILIFGGSGLLGSKLVKTFSSDIVLSPTHKEVNLINAYKVLNYIKKNKPDVIIYAAGITRIDDAEKDKNLTLKLNNKIPGIISRFSAKNNIHLIYISSDAVFDGYKEKFKFKEDDKPKAISFYGKSKILGEKAVFKNNPESTIVRLITLYNLESRNFVARMIEDLKNGKTFSGITDQIQNPLNTEIASRAINYIVKNSLRGTYNLGATNYVSNFDFLVKISKKMKLNSKLIIPITFRQFTKDKKSFRKQKSVLNIEKFNQITKEKILENIDTTVKNII